MLVAMPPLPNTHSCCGAQLKHKDDFTLPFYIYYCNSDSEGVGLPEFDQG
jgi:hypothetical protein